jgi:argininosuccinate lyase
MPQKKNPYPLTYIRGLCGHFIGAFPSFASLGKVSSGNPDSRIFIYDTLPDALEKASGALTLFAELTKEVSFNKELMLKRISKGFGMATDISDFLILHRYCDYRTAHHIVGKLIRTLVEAGKGGSDISAELLNGVAKEFGITSLNISEKELMDLVNPSSIVSSRQTLGGASQGQMVQMLKKIDLKLERHKSWFSLKEEANQIYKTKLIQKAKQIIS